MDKVWSFNTTVRNPERMENMLRALSELDGIDFDGEGQEAYFGLQIKKRLYKPEKRTLEEQDLINIVHDDFSADDIEDQFVERIIDKYRGKSVDSAGRGRTAAGILNRFGLCVALQSKGKVRITNLAKKWLNHEISDFELFTKFFIKWQYPNHIESGYTGFNIKPFVGVISLIDKVNKLWASLGNRPVGLSKMEYMLFAPSLINASDIDKYAEEIVTFRVERSKRKDKDKVNFTNSYILTRCSEIFGNKKAVKLALSDLEDYTDSSIRYFRMSGLISLRGNDTHVDISQDKRVEVDSILKNISPFARDYNDYEEYFAYLSDIDSIELPWENKDDLKEISEHLIKVLQDESDIADVELSIPGVGSLPIAKKVNILEQEINQVRINKLKNLKHDTVVLDECISKLDSIMNRGYETLTARPSLDLEWYVARCLHVLNDAIKISPSFNVGDDGIPTGFRSNVSDIECFYDTFNMTVEVTLMLGRDQWTGEGQPVMRHLRDFENRNTDKNAYCLFIAPIIHRDTLNTFWNGNKFGYEGRCQKIIPLTLAQFTEILTRCKEKIESGTLNHKNLGQLFDTIFIKTEDINIPVEWTECFPKAISGW